MTRPAAAHAVLSLACLVLAACSSSAADEPAADQAAGPEPFKITVPQNDLDVTVDGFRIIPPMGMGSWAAFAPTGAGDEMVVMGDLVLREDEIGSVQRALVERGLTVTGLHNHFVRDEPAVMYMHVGGRGPRDALRADVEEVLATVADLRGGDPASAPADDVENTLDTAALARIVGHDGEASRGVWKATIGRPDVDLRSTGVPVTTDMGFNTWASWQGTPERAAVAGDFAMLEDEVAPVIEALVEHGIEVVAVHNHMVHEEPRPHASWSQFWDLDGFSESYLVHIDNHFAFENGAFFQLPGFNFAGEGLREPFEIREGAIPAGSYHYVDWEFRANTNRGAPLSLSGGWDLGGFYSGTRFAPTATLAYRYSDLLSLSMRADWFDVHLDEGDFTTAVVALNGSYAFSPRVYLQLNVQYNDDTEDLSTNARFGWHDTAGTGLLAVYNGARHMGSLARTGISAGPRQRQLVIKYSRLFDLGR